MTISIYTSQLESAKIFIVWSRRIQVIVNGSKVGKNVTTKDMEHYFYFSPMWRKVTPVATFVANIFIALDNAALYDGTKLEIQCKIAFKKAHFEDRKF